MRTAPGGNPGSRRPGDHHPDINHYANSRLDFCTFIEAIDLFQPDPARRF